MKTKNIIFFCIFSILFSLLTGCIVKDVDVYAKDYNFSTIPNQIGISKEEFLQNYEALLENVSGAAKGDVLIIIGRLEEDPKKICEASNLFLERAEITENEEEKALMYESAASLGCENKGRFFLKASEIWKELGNEFRSELDRKLAYGKDLGLYFDTRNDFEMVKQQRNYSKIIIGRKSLELDASSLIVSQTDRVSRDWLSYQLNQKVFGSELLTVFSERLTYDEDELRKDIGWHEGARIKEMAGIGLKHRTASGTIVAEKDGRWYAPNEEGVFMFELPEDKILYPTNRFLAEGLVLVMDTHGVNMLVEQALRYGADAVVGCCDHPGKVKAAKYLAEKGVGVICFTDRFVPLIMGQKLSVLGSAPISIGGGVVKIGGQAVEIYRGEKIVAQNISLNDDVQMYYDTAARYFSRLDSMYDVGNIEYYNYNNEDGAAGLVDYADSVGAEVIGGRVFNSADYLAYKRWLEEDEQHRMVLFHSESYPYGYKLMKEFKEQTSFDDIDPVLE